MSYAVLPSFLVLLIIGELGDDVLVDSTQSFPLVLAVLDCHGNQSHVRIGRLLRLGGLLLGCGADVQELHSLLPLSIHGLSGGLRPAAAKGDEWSGGSATIAHAGADSPPTGCYRKKKKKEIRKKWRTPSFI